PEITLSGYLGGMPLACAVGRGLNELRERSKLGGSVPERNVALLGARDLDPPEADALAASEVTLVRSDQLANQAAFEAALAKLRGVEQLYLHIDIDVLDPAEAPGINYPAGGGLTVGQLQDAVRQVVAFGNVGAIALTAVDPDKDVDGRTVAAAIQVIETAIGQLCEQSA
ncbi:MAG TPA: arginase family protein, partial [Roseiflexaceae bacterium]|nr:arginase family protein [Roseiflexaceae bacterium]